jgi:imidazolonepropionase-like amidohydrolase
MSHATHLHGRALRPVAATLLAGLGLLGLASPAAAHGLCIVGAEVRSPGLDAAPRTVCIDDGRIAAIYPESARPAADQQIDGTGLWLTPGFVDAATQLGLVEIEQEEDGNDADGGGDPVRAGLRAEDAFNPGATAVTVTRQGGVTSVISCNGGGLISGTAQWFDLAGDSVAAMTSPGAELLFATAGGRAAHAVGGSRADAMLRYRELLDDARAYYANQAAYDQSRLRALSVSRVDLEALRPFVTGQKTIVFEAHRRADLESVLRLAAEQRLRVALRGGEEAWRIAPLLAERAVPVIVDAMANLPSSLDEIGSREDNAALLDRAGVPVILTAGDAHNARNLRFFAGNAVRAGLPWDSALAAITLRPARLAGRDREVGSIEVGKLASLALWTGDPFETSTVLRRLWIAGREVPTSSRQHDLLERYRSLDGRAVPR